MDMDGLDGPISEIMRIYWKNHKTIFINMMGGTIMVRWPKNANFIGDSSNDFSEICMTWDGMGWMDGMDVIKCQICSV